MGELYIMRALCLHGIYMSASQLPMFAPQFPCLLGNLGRL